MTLQIVNEDNFGEEVLCSDKPVLVDFYADWCGPCKSIAPVLEELASNNDKVKIVKLNADDSREVAEKYGVRGLPTLMYFVDGEVVRTKVGALTKTQINDFVNA